MNSTNAIGCSMLEAYCDIQADIDTRAASIGRLLVIDKHHQCTDIAFKVITPFATKIVRRGVVICVGVAQDGQQVTVAVPADIFDAAGTKVAEWIADENDRVLQSLDAKLLESKLRHQEQEMAMLQELAVKYPEAIARMTNG